MLHKLRMYAKKVYYKKYNNVLFAEGEMANVSRELNQTM